MRTSKINPERERIELWFIVAACALWILWHDIGTLLPLAGVVGGLLAIAREQRHTT